jgi:hypothetical protein
MNWKLRVSISLACFDAPTWDLDGFFLLLLIGVSVAPSTAFAPNSAKVIAIKSFCSA